MQEERANGGQAGMDLPSKSCVNSQAAEADWRHQLDNKQPHKTVQLERLNSQAEGADARGGQQDEQGEPSEAKLLGRATCAQGKRLTGFVLDEAEVSDVDNQILGEFVCLWVKWRRCSRLCFHGSRFSPFRES